MYNQTAASRAYHEDIQRRQRIATERELAAEPTNEQIKAYLERESMTVEQEARRERDNETSKAWVVSNPEYVANPRNGQLMLEYLESRGLPTTPDTLSAAFAHLKAKGLVEVHSLDAEIHKQAHQDEVSRRAKELRNQAALHSTDELYEMPIENLRDLALRRGR
jgi:hypothetical protein